MSKSLYDEAIAEAKSLRVVAEQNAKNAIVEAVTPKIKEFIEEQLLNESRLPKDDDGNSDFIESAVSEIFSKSSDDEDVIIDESALMSLVGLLGEKDLANNKTTSQVVRSAINESASDLSAEERKSLLSIAKKLEENVDSFRSSKINIDNNLRENSAMSQKDEILYEIDLDELSNTLNEAAKLEISLDDSAAESLRGLEGFLGDASVMLDLEEVDDDDEGDDEGDEDLEFDDLPPMDDMPEEEPMPEDPGLEEEGYRMDEVFEIDPRMLKQEIHRLRRRISEGEDLSAMKGGADPMESQFGGAGSASVGIANVYGGKKSKGQDAFGGGSRSGDAFESPPDMNKLSEVRKLQRQLRKESRKNRTLQGKLNEYRGAIGTLREQLTELNLFNAKLLYVNKLLQTKGVTASQRRSIVESIDKARSLREVKLLYKSLTGSIKKDKARTLSESAVRRTLGSSSRATSSASAQSGASSEFDRWATLAGLK